MFVEKDGELDWDDGDDWYNTIRGLKKQLLN